MLLCNFKARQIYFLSLESKVLILTSTEVILIKVVELEAGQIFLAFLDVLDVSYHNKTGNNRKF